jgi:hypothetical protein
MLTIVTFLWKPRPGYRSKFSTQHVNVLRRMVRRHYRQPHRFVLLTDDPTGITEPDIEVFELWRDFANVQNPSGRGNPSCYRRLRLFAPEPGKFLGERFVCLDLDTVIVDDMAPVWDRDDDFVIWKSGTSGNPYNGSMFMLKAGARPNVWLDFDPVWSPINTRRAGLYGSDQAWIAHSCGAGEKTWSAADGVLSFRLNLEHRSGGLPERSRIVFFHGNGDPWDPPIQKRYPWVKKAWA